MSTDQDQLLDVLRSTRPILLDFDGPVTKLLPAGPNAELADAARSPLRSSGIELPPHMENTTDHLAVLRFAAINASAAVLAEVEDICDRGEAGAAVITPPTPGAHDALRAFSDMGRPVVVVSNNSAKAIRSYLNHHGLTHLVVAIIGREPGHPELMKPDPHIITKALDLLTVPAQQCALIGDQVTDIIVSRRTGVRSIGYAKTPRRGNELAEAGADALVVDIRDLADAVRRVHPLSN